MTPFEHNLNCNLVTRRSEEPKVCTCEAIAIKEGLADIDAGRVTPRRKKKPLPNIPSWLSGSIVESFSKLDEKDLHYSYCPRYRLNVDTGEYPDCTCDATGHQPECVHLTDPYMYCNCNYLADKEKPMTTTPNLDPTATIAKIIASHHTGLAESQQRISALEAVAQKLQADLAEAYRRIDLHATATWEPREITQDEVDRTTQVNQRLSQLENQIDRQGDKALYNELTADAFQTTLLQRLAKIEDHLDANQKLAGPLMPADTIDILVRINKLEQRVTTLENIESYRPHTYPTTYPNPNTAPQTWWTTRYENTTNATWPPQQETK